MIDVSDRSEKLLVSTTRTEYALVIAQGFLHGLFLLIA